MFIRILKILYFFIYPLEKILCYIARVLRHTIWSAKLGEYGHKSRIHSRVVIHSPRNVRIGNNVAIAEFVHIWGGGGVHIGDYTIIATHCVITSVTHDTNRAPYQKTLIRMPVMIGSNVWLGSGAVILPGIKIGDNAIIGAGAVVTKNVMPNTVVAGIPAKLIR